MAEVIRGVYASVQRSQVFIVCDQSDDEWAEKCRGILTHSTHNLNVATNSRDFVAGRTVKENYECFIANSSKILLLLTPRFITNVWKPYLENIIRHHNIIHRVIPVMLSKCKVPKQLKDKVCINVSSDQLLFYKQLSTALQEKRARQGDKIYDHLQRPLPSPPYQQTPGPTVTPFSFSSPQTPSSLTITSRPTQSLEQLYYTTMTPSSPPPQPPARQRITSVLYRQEYIDVVPEEDQTYEPVEDQARRGQAEDNQGYEDVNPLICTRRSNTMYAIPGNVTQLTKNEECKYGDTGNAKTLKETMLTKEYFFKNPKKFIAQFNSTTGRKHAKTESFIVHDLMDSSSDPSSELRDDHQLLSLLANCKSAWVVRKALDNLLNEIFLSIGDTERGRNVLEAEEVLRKSIKTILVEEHRVAKTQRITTYGWLVTLILLRWNDLYCSIPQLYEISMFDKTLERLQKENKERNLFRYGLSMTREAIRRMTSKSQDLKDIAKRHLRICENILNSRMENSEITKLGESIDDNSWLDLHVCLVFLQELPQLHKFKDDVEPVALIQKLITNSRVRFRQYNTITKYRKRLPSSESDWRLELLVYRVLLKLLRPPTCTAIINQVVNGSPGCDGIKAYWSNDYGLNRSQFAMEYLRKLCRKAIFVPEPKARLDLVFFAIDFREVLIPEELSIVHLRSMYRNQGLYISSLNSRNVVQKNVTSHDVVLSGEKGFLEIFKHSRNQVLPSDFPDEFSQFRNEIEILRNLDEASKTCPNIIRFLGSGVDLPAHIITERPTKGNLVTCLKKHRINWSNITKLRAVALDVCKAMIFLGELGIVHRDLRAANVFAFDNEEGEITFKLGDFRFSKVSSHDSDSHSSTSGSWKSIVVSPDDPDYRRLSVRWMAAESLQIGEFSLMSDVWSYGMLLFEIFTFGCTPYLNMPSGLSLTNDDDVKKFILDGCRLELYQSIPVQIKLIIESTWIENKNERPAFVDLKSQLEETEFQQERCVEPSTYEKPYIYNNDTLCRTRLSKTVCPVNNCSGDCLNLTGATFDFQVGDIKYTKEMIPLEKSSDIQQLENLEHPALAVIKEINTHIENVELVTEVGDMGNLSQFIKECGCSRENAMFFLTKIAEAITFLHSRGVIHCYIRAEAVFIYSNRGVRLAHLTRVRRLKSGSPGGSLRQRASMQIEMPEDSVRWSAPEVNKDGTYSQSSDVWAFGVLMWELFTLKDVDAIENETEISSVPYNNLTSNKQILAFLEMSNRLSKPDSCPHWLYIVMTECWLSERLERPSMAAILDCLTHRRPFQSWLLKQWLRRRRNRIYENWPDINVEQDEELDHVVPTQRHSTDENLCSLSNDEFIGGGLYHEEFIEGEYCEVEEQPEPSKKQSRKPIPVPRSNTNA